MEKNEINKIADEYYLNLHRCLKRISRKSSISSIHAFRLAYKQLRAFLRMLSFDKSNPGKLKISKKIKKIYTIAGHLRELQLQINQPRQSPMPKKPGLYSKELNKEIEKLKLKLHGIKPGKTTQSSKRKTLYFLPAQVLPVAISNYFAEKKKKIYTIISSKTISDADLHTLRKNLKDYFYNLRVNLLQTKRPISVNAAKKKTQFSFREMDDDLGAFHDKCVSVDLQKHYMLKVHRLTRQKKQGIIKIWTKHKLNLKTALIKKLKSSIIL